MLTVCIQYQLDMHKLGDFENYARGWPEPIARCGGTLVGYYLPTKFAGPTNSALALIDFPTLAAYEDYRRCLADDPAVQDMITRADESGCIVVENRSILQRVSGASV